MLNVFRENLKHLKWVLLAVVASFILTIFAVWGGGVGNGGSKGEDLSWAARVGDQVIGVQAFQTEARNLEYSYRQILGDQFDKQRQFLKVGQMAINRLVDQQLLAREAAKAGLKVSEQEVAEAIMKDPSFQQNGVFIGKARYEQIFRTNQAMLQEYEQRVQQQLLLDKLRSLLEDSVSVSDADLREAYARQNEKISFQYFLLGDSRISVPAPTDQALESYYHQHASDYTSGEGRTGRYVLFDLKEAISKTDIPEAEVRSEYLQGQKTLYTVPEKRRASHILIKVPSNATPEQTRAAEAKAKKALARVRSGEDFAKVAREMSEDSTASSGGDLNYFTRDQMVKEFADAVWAMKVGQISDLVRSPFGFHIIRLTDIQPGHEMTLEEARPKILASLKAERAKADVLRQAQDFASKAAGQGGDFGKAAAEMHVTVHDFKALHPGEAFPGLGMQQALESQLFSLRVGGISPPVSLASGEAVVQFLSSTPAGPLPFDKVKDKVKQDLLSQARLEEAKKMIAAAGGTADLAATAKRLKLEVKNEGPITRSGPFPGLSAGPDLADRLFSLKAGGTLGPMAAPDGVAVVKVVSHTDPMAGFDTGKEALRTRLAAAKRDRLFRAYVEDLRAAARVEINNALVDQVDRS